MLLGTSYNQQAEASGTRDGVLDSPIPDNKPVKTPDLESVKEDIKVKDDSPVAEDRADLNLLEPENNEKQNDMLSGKRPEQENDETMP
jgi:hypothetical protein